jgi:hypothetical protein
MPYSGRSPSVGNTCYSRSVSTQRASNVRITSLMTCMVLLSQANFLAAYSAAAAFPEPWITVSIEEVWGPCYPSEHCARSWTMRANSSNVRVEKNGKTSSKQLDPADLSSIKAIVGGRRRAQFAAAHHGGPQNVAHPWVGLPRIEFMLRLMRCQSEVRRASRLFPLAVSV